tara:strand:+ start:223 stop:342 length:120 start_codon:yes stop_codon:yes gene_type:complete
VTSISPNSYLLPSLTDKIISKSFLLSESWATVVTNLNSG